MATSFQTQQQSYQKCQSIDVKGKQILSQSAFVQFNFVHTDAKIQPMLK